MTKGTKQKEPDKLTATEGNTETCAVLSHHRVGNYKLRLKQRFEAVVKIQVAQLDVPCGYGNNCTPLAIIDTVLGEVAHLK